MLTVSIAIASLIVYYVHRAGLLIVSAGHVLIKAVNLNAVAA